jgi:alpha-tubulin suppressor-like RCC1 family protein
LLGDQFAPETVPAGLFAAIAGANSHACGITDDGEVLCWGNNQNGQTDVP